MFLMVNLLNCLLLFPYSSQTPILTDLSSSTYTAAPQTVLMLAHRWECKALLLDLKVDGNFEGRFGQESGYYGLWNLEKDRKTLTLQHDPLDEEEFKYQYEVVQISFDTLRLKNKAGKIITLYLKE